MLMRALVIGGDGNLGRALCGRLTAGGHDMTYTTRRQGGAFPTLGQFYLDVRDLLLPEMPLAEGKRNVVYLMAAITGFARCEEDPEAWLVNAEAPVALAQQARARGWHVVFVTSGAPERATHTALAMQKSYAGLGVLLLGGCVVRPLPAVPPAQYDAFADLLVRVGEEGRTGLVRWEEEP
jgi:RmlD substrate binding domain